MAGEGATEKGGTTQQKQEQEEEEEGEGVGGVDKKAAASTLHSAPTTQTSLTS